MSPTVKKYKFRAIVAVCVFFFFKAVMSPSVEELWQFGKKEFVYLCFAFIMVIGMWEVTDKVFAYVKCKAKSTYLSSHDIVKYFVMCFVVTTLVSPLIAYLDVYTVGHWLKCAFPLTQDIAFWKSLISAFGVGSMMTSMNLIHHFFQHQRKTEVLEEQLKRAELASKYESLKNQVNPHFLFNSLSVLTSLVYKSQDTAAEFINQLSKIYRYVLENQDKELVSLEKEVQFLESFFFLLQIRHENAIQLQIDLPIDTENYQVPPLTLQMLVENAIKHNSFHKESPLQVTLSCEDQMLSICNNCQARNISENSTNVGLSNIRSRLALHSQIPIEIEHTEEKFCVKIPLIAKLGNKFRAA